MKRTKRAITLVAVLLAVSIATLLLTRYEEKKESIQNSDAVILEIPYETVQSLSWEYEDSSFAFHRSGDKWLYNEDEAFPVDEAKLKTILSGFESFGVAFVIEQVEDYGQYGLDDPECIISLTSDTGSYSVRLGNFSKMDEQRYVDIGDGNVYLVRNDPMDTLKSQLSELILHDSCPDLYAVTEFTFSGEEELHIVYTEQSTDSYSEEDLYFLERSGKQLPLDTSKVETYLETVSTLSLTNYVTYNVTSDELTSFGLDNPEHTLLLHYTDTNEAGEEVSDTLILHIGRNPEEAAAAEEARANEEETIPSVTSYVRINQSQIVYQLSDSDYLALTTASYDDFRHSEVFWADYTDITGFEITLEDATHSFTSAVSEEDETELLWSYNGENIDISNLKVALYSVYMTTFSDELPEKKEEIRLTVHLDHALYPQVTLSFYRYNGSSCLVAVDGEYIGFTNRSSVVSLIESVQEIVLN